MLAWLLPPIIATIIHHVTLMSGSLQDNSSTIHTQKKEAVATHTHRKHTLSFPFQLETN